MSEEGFVIGEKDEEKEHVNGSTALILDSQGKPVEKTLEEMITGASNVDMGEFSQSNQLTVFQVDCSGSMASYLEQGAWSHTRGRFVGRNDNSLPKIELMKKMVYKYIKNRFEKNEHSKLGLVSFESVAQVVVELCSDEEELLNCVQQLRTGGSTNMSDGLRASVGLLKKNHGLGIPRIVLISDGAADSTDAVFKVIEEEKDYVLTIDSIYIGRKGEVMWLQFMEKLAQLTGGTFEQIESEAEFETKFLQVVDRPLLTSGKLGNALKE